MQTHRFTVGKWRAEARMQELETGNLMAVVSVTDEKGTAATGSRHTLVFQHQCGKDRDEEIEALVRRLIRDHYRI